MTLIASACAQLRQQPSLADPGFSSHRDDPALRRRLERPLDGPKLRETSDQLL
jgi:hypothetical protein